MHPLDHKIPPPLVALLLVACMWGLSAITPHWAVPQPYRWPLLAVIVLVGAAFSCAGAMSFRRARTTVNPMKPEAASALVSSGVYRVTRNPMYVGLLLLLCAWGVFLSAPWSLLGPVAFYFYISRFQIVPEERALTKLFGTEYTAYQAKVRRWL